MADRHDLAWRLVAFGLGSMFWSAVALVAAMIWDAKQPVPTDVATDTVTDTPTDIPAEIVTAAPTEAPTHIPTDMPTAVATPSLLPDAGAVLPDDPYLPWEWSPEYWRIEGFPNLIMTHNGSDSGFGDQVVRLRRGDIFPFGPSDFEVVGILRVEPDSVWALAWTERFDFSIMTCSGFNPVLKEWKYRVFVFLREVPRKAHPS